VTESASSPPTSSRLISPPLLVALLAVLFLVAHFNLKPVVGDEGVLAMDGWRMAQGQVPHRDFFQFIPPMAGFLQAGFIRVLGPTVLALRLAGFLCGVLLVLALALLISRLLVSPLARAVPLAVLVPFGVGVWPFASHHWWVDIFLLFALVLLLEAERREAPFSWAAAAGALLGASVLTLQDQGLYAALGTALVALPLFRSGTRGKALAGCAVGFAATIFPAAAFLVQKASLATLWADFVLFPLRGYHGALGNRMGLSKGIVQVLSQWDPVALRIAPVYTALIATASMVVYALPLLAAVSLVATWRRSWLPPARLALLAVFSMAFLGAAFHRWSLMNLIWAASLPAVAVALPLDRGLASQSPILRKLSCATCIAILAIFCGFGLLRIWATRHSQTRAVATQAGTYRVFNPYEARDLQSFCDAVSTHVPPDEPMFCVGFCPLLNFVTGHPNPTAFNFLITPAYNGPPQITRWIEALERDRTSWGFGPNTPPSPTDPADMYLRAHYRPAWSNDTYILWRRHER
jgi:4-amino-4-deoxy-L-arabinose transferase-like glycosyltransferase